MNDYREKEVAFQHYGDLENWEPGYLLRIDTGGVIVECAQTGQIIQVGSVVALRNWADDCFYWYRQVEDNTTKIVLYEMGNPIQAVRNKNGKIQMLAGDYWKTI